MKAIAQLSIDQLRSVGLSPRKVPAAPTPTAGCSWAGDVDRPCFTPRIGYNARTSLKMPRTIAKHVRSS
jgi:hypothetical protein